MKVKISLFFEKKKKDVHKKLAKALNFPDYYGNNLDALWDLLLEPHEPWDIEFTRCKAYTKRNKDSLNRFKEVFSEAKENGAKVNVSFVD